MRRRRALQVDEDRRASGQREAAQEVEVRRFLQRALEPFGHLLLRVINRRARPGGLHDHRLDDECRVLIPAQAFERNQPGQDRGDHQVDDERAVLERPFGDVDTH